MRVNPEALIGVASRIGEIARGIPFQPTVETGKTESHPQPPSQEVKGQTRPFHVVPQSEALRRAQEFRVSTGGAPIQNWQDLYHPPTSQ